MSATPARTLLVITPGAVPLRQYLRDLLHHRDLIRMLAVRDVKLRYRQTALGASWVVIQPLLSAGILGFVFGKVAKLPTDGVPFFVFSFAGLLCWSAFSSAVSRCSTSLTSSAGLVSKIFFPRLILPLSKVAAVLLDFVVTLVVLVVLVFANDLSPGAPSVLVPVWLLLTLMLAEGLGSILASFSVRYRDIHQVVPVVLQLMLFASPVAYSTAAVPDRYQALYHANPMAPLLEAFRWSTLGTPPPAGHHLAYAAFTAVLVFVIGTIVLEKMERGFADVI